VSPVNFNYYQPNRVPAAASERHTLSRVSHSSNLVDEFQMIVCPVVDGSGKRFFPDGVRLNLDLVEERCIRGVRTALRRRRIRYTTVPRSSLEGGIPRPGRHRSPQQGTSQAASGGIGYEVVQHDYGSILLLADREGGPPGPRSIKLRRTDRTAWYYRLGQNSSRSPRIRKIRCAQCRRSVGCASQERKSEIPDKNCFPPEFQLRLLRVVNPAELRARTGGTQ
jgi:hypothetical protein